MSPALSARSSTISKRSPSVSNRSLLSDPNSVLVCVAEECFSKARGNLQDVVSSSSGGAVTEYQKLIATGLSCLETVLREQSAHAEAGGQGTAALCVDSI